MTVPSFDSIGHIPLVTDVDVVDRLGGMLDCAIRRQVWLMFLDEEDRQLPMIMPSYVPARPRKGDQVRLGAFIRGLVDEMEADAVVVTYERRAGPMLAEADRVWLRCLRDACLASGVRFRGPYLCHLGGVMQVAPDDYA